MPAIACTLQLWNIVYIMQGSAQSTVISFVATGAHLIQKPDDVSFDTRNGNTRLNRKQHRHMLLVSRRVVYQNLKHHILIDMMSRGP